MSSEKEGDSYKPLEDTYNDVMKALNTTKETATCVNQKVKKDTEDLHTLFKGPVCT